MKKLFATIFLLVNWGNAVNGQPTSPLTRVGAHADVVATYSIIGWDSLTGDLGVAVQSRFLAVGAVVPYAKAGVGALATQAWANTEYGPRGLESLENGLSPREVVETLLKSDPGSSKRQIGIVDARGYAYAYTGSGCLPYAGHITGHGYSAQGNILSGDGVVKAMARMFEMTPGDLPDRLLSALDAAQRAEGEKGERQSAAILVVRERGGYGGFNDRMIDLRVDDDSLPLFQLRRIYKVWQQSYLPEVQMRSIEMFNQRKNFAAAQELTRRMVSALNEELREKPDDPDMLTSVAWALTTNNIDRVRALELAKRAVKLVPGNSNILNTLAECHYQLRHFDEAIAIESELVGKDPTNDNYWKQLQKFKEAKQEDVK